MAGVAYQSPDDLTFYPVRETKKWITVFYILVKSLNQLEEFDILGNTKFRAVKMLFVNYYNLHCTVWDFQDIPSLIAE